MAFTKVAPAGIGSTPGDGYRIGDSFLHSTGVEITNINATGIVTAASLDISGAIDFDGHTELDNVNISGVSTFAGNIDANGDLDVDGHTNLDNVSVSGVSTFSGIVAAGVGSTAVSLANGKMLTFGSDHELEMFHDGSQSYIKQRWFAYPSALNIISENSQLNLMSGSGGNLHGGYENAITCHNNSHVKLYYGGTLALQTTGYGAEVLGSLLINMGQLRLQDEIRHDGDSDTKIRFPANDTISFETAGSERLRINNVGNLGFGMTPNAWHTNNQKVFQISGTNAGLNIFTRSGSAHLSSNFIYNSSDAGVFQAASGYAMHHAVSATNGTFDWKSSSAASSSAGSAATMVTRLRITSTGKVGINETSPDNMLHVRSDNTPAAKIGGEGGSAYYMEIGQLTTSSSPGFNATGNSASMLFKMNGSEKFRIGPAGQFGLAGSNYGTSGQVLTSQGNSATPTWSTITGTTINSNADNRIITGSGTANTLNGESSFTYNAGLLIQSNSNGNVQTQMNATSGDAKIVLDNSGNGNYSGIDFERERSSGAGVNGGSIFMKSDTSGNNAFLYIQAQSASAQAPVTSALSNDNGVRLLLRGGEGIFSVEPGAAERLRLDTNGRLGLSHNLSGTSDYNRLMLHNPHSGSCWMQMTSTASGSGANTDGLSIGLNTSNHAHFWLRENADMYFATNGTKRWTITSSGDLIPGGNYNIGLNSNTAFRMQEVNSVKFVHRYGTSGSATNNQQEAIWYGGGITTMHDNLTLSTTNYTWGLTGVRGYALIRIRNGAGSPQAIYAEAGSISSGSDYRMKENIEEITNGIETVKKLKPSIYNIRKTFNPNDDGKKHHGFVAHEVQEAIPDIGNIVSGTKDAMEEVFYEDEDENIPAGKKPGDSTGTFTDKPDYQGIDYGHMTPVLAAAIKELITKVETLEAKVATLEGS